MGTTRGHGHVAFSSSSKGYIHDVFLSFRGGDTRNNFTGHLYTALERVQTIKPFMDNELPRGKEISAELVEAIKGSRISLIVFSRGYADSGWCLEELVKIMECRRVLGQIVFPIFYDVDPSQVRHQTGRFARAFQKVHKHADHDQVQSWIDALTEASNLSGWHIADRNEAEIIKKIVNEVEKQLQSAYLSVAVYQVGIAARIENVCKSLSVESHDVQMVGIWGMGGMGKSSIARAIYNKFFHSFGYKSFLASVRETAKDSSGMIILQEKLLSDILESTKIEVGDVHRGINVIKERLGCRRVLVVIDDVDQLDQLNVLAINRCSLGPGSIIIVTTRDRHILEHLEVNTTYLIEEMTEEEALELFSWHAFKNYCPDKGYVELSRRVVAYCAGLPLALEVLGSFLFKRSTKEWEDTLKKLERIPRAEIQEKLRISFDALNDDNEREIFLDISCFFIGMDKNYVTQILEGCGSFAEIGISVLLQRCLVTLNEKNKLMMHDLLRDMGREIVRAKSPNKHKCSRLWHQEDVTEVLTDESGTKDIEGITLNLLRSDNVSFNTKAFRKMKRLRLLQLNYVHLTGDYKYLPNKLRWLCWRGFPLQFIPKEAFNLIQNLVSIDLRYSNLIRFWEDSKLLGKLKILNLSHSHYLTQSPDFSKFPNLEYLILKDCTRLSAVHQSIGHLEGLALVNLKNCIMLKDLPRSFYKLKSLITLDLSGCSLENLDEDIGEMESLENLHLDKNPLRKLPGSLKKLRNLKFLSLRSTKLLDLPYHPFPLRSTKLLDLPHHPFSNTYWMPFAKLPQFPDLSNLRELSLTGCNFTDYAIPDFLHSLCCLKCLTIERSNLNRLPSLSVFSNLESLCLKKCTYLHAIVDLPTSALERMSNISKMLNMRSLHLSHSLKLNAVPGLERSVNSLTLIQMERCTNLTATLKGDILQVPTGQQSHPACGNGGVFLPGNDIPNWFENVNDEGDHVYFQVPRMTGCTLKALAVCIVFSCCLDKERSPSTISILVANPTKLTSFIVLPIHPYAVALHEVIWLGHLSNNDFNLEGGDFVEVCVVVGPSSRVKKTGVNLVWEPTFINENMIECASVPFGHFVSDADKEGLTGPSHDSSDEDR